MHLIYLICLGVLNEKKGDLLKSVVEFSKTWRKDKHLRQLEAMMLVLNRKHIFILSGTGDVVEPEDGEIGSIGSGGNYAISFLARGFWDRTTSKFLFFPKESLSLEKGRFLKFARGKLWFYYTKTNFTLFGEGLIKGLEVRLTY